jgi:hypothetical protein
MNLSKMLVGLARKVSIHFQVPQNLISQTCWLLYKTKYGLLIDAAHTWSCIPADKYESLQDVGCSCQKSFHPFPSYTKLNISNLLVAIHNQVWVANLCSPYLVMYTHRQVNKFALYETYMYKNMINTQNTKTNNFIKN